MVVVKILGPILYVAIKIFSVGNKCSQVLFLKL